PGRPGSGEPRAPAPASPCCSGERRPDRRCYRRRRPRAREGAPPGGWEISAARRILLLRGSAAVVVDAEVVLEIVGGRVRGDDGAVEGEGAHRGQVAVDDLIDLDAAGKELDGPGGVDL